MEDKKKKKREEKLQRRLRDFNESNLLNLEEPPGLDLCAIKDMGHWEKVTIDSAAEESACPKEWGEQYGVEKVKPGREMKLVTASGQRIDHFGSRRVEFSAEDAEGKSKKMNLGFQVCGVKKPLAAVWRICESGNIVQFGPRDEDCFISNKMNGDKVYMRREGGSYVLDMKFEKPF